MRPFQDPWGSAGDAESPMYEYSFIGVISLLLTVRIALIGKLIFLNALSYETIVLFHGNLHKDSLGHALSRD